MADNRDAIHYFDPSNPSADLTRGVGFNGTDPERLTIRKYDYLGSVWYGVQLSSPPGYKTLPSSVSPDSIRVLVVRADNPAVVFTEVGLATTIPSSGQFWVDYYNVVPGSTTLLPGNTSTGLMRFNPTHVGVEVDVYYWQTGPAAVPNNLGQFLAGSTVTGDLTVEGELIAPGLDSASPLNPSARIRQKRISFAFNVDQVATVVAHGISNAYTQDRIVSVVGTVKKTTAGLVYLSTADMGAYSISQCYWNDTNMTFIRTAFFSGQADEFHVMISYLD